MFNCILDTFLKIGLLENDEPNKLGFELEKLNELQRAFNENCIDKTMECLLEGPDKTGKNYIYRTPYMQQCVVSVPAGTTAPTLAQIKITDANKASLRGKIV